MTSYDVTIPANTSATLYLPITGEVSACEGLRVTGSAIHNAVETMQIELVAGTGHFEIVAGDVIVSVS